MIQSLGLECRAQGLDAPERHEDISNQSLAYRPGVCSRSGEPRHFRHCLLPTLAHTQTPQHNLSLFFESLPQDCNVGFWFQGLGLRFWGLGRGV